MQQEGDAERAALAAHKTDWEALAALDPMWAILSDPAHKHNRWQVDEFFATGATEVGHVLARLELLRRPERRGAMLDFGCGIGRLTRAFAPHFEHCLGIDIAEGMISAARVHNAQLKNCEFQVNDRPDLQLIPSATLDLIYTNIVLQHLPSRAAIEGYLREFVRVLRPGGALVFQLPCHIHWLYRLMLRRRAYVLLRALGVSDRMLHEKLGLTSMRMSYLPVAEVRAFLAQQGMQVLDVVQVADGPTLSATYYAAKT